MAGNKNKKIRLEDIPKKNPYRVPDGYFESFNDRLNERLKTEEKKPVRTLRLMLRSNLALAAAILTFALISYFSFRLITGGSLVEAGQSISYTEFLEEEIYRMDDALLLETYEQLEEQKESVETETSNEDELSDEIIEYLAAEDIDLSLIYEEL